MEVKSIIDYIKTKYPKVEFSPFKLKASNAVAFLISGGKIVIGYVKQDGGLCKLHEPVDLQSLTKETLASALKKVPQIDGFTENDRKALEKLVFESQGDLSEQERIKADLVEMLKSKEAEYKVLYDKNSEQMISIKREYTKTVDELRHALDGCKASLKNGDELSQKLQAYKEEMSKAIQEKDNTISNLQKKMEEFNKIEEQIKGERDELIAKLDLVNLQNKDKEIIDLKGNIQKLREQLANTTDELTKKLDDARVDNCREQILGQKEQIASRIKEYNAQWEKWLGDTRHNLDDHKAQLKEELRQIQRGLSFVAKNTSSGSDREELAKLKAQVKEQLELVKSKEFEVQGYKGQLKNLEGEKNALKQKLESNTVELEKMKGDNTSLKKNLEETLELLESVKKGHDFEKCYDSLSSFIIVSNDIVQRQTLIGKVESLIADNNLQENEVTRKFGGDKARMKELLGDLEDEIRSYRQNKLFDKLVDKAGREQVQDDEKGKFCDGLLGVYSRYRSKEEALKGITAQIEGVLDSIQKGLVETKGVKVLQNNRELSGEEKKTIEFGDMNKGLQACQGLENKLEDTPPTTIKDEELANALRLLRTIVEDNGSDATVELLELYIEVIKALTMSPAMLKLTSLSLDELKQVLKRDDIQLWYTTPESKVMNKDHAWAVLQAFLYIDITPIITSSATELSTFKTNYLDPIGEQIKNDTTNYNTAIQNDTTNSKNSNSNNNNNKYLFIKRFQEILTAMLRGDDGYIEYMKSLIRMYIVKNVYSILMFSRMNKFIESSANDQFNVQLNEILKNKVKNNVLTYVKLRNDDGASYNGRFKVYYNLNQSRPDKDDKTMMLVRYNDHNLPYYVSQDGKMMPSSTLKADFEAIYPSKSADSYFKMLSNDIEVLKYDANYALGPFTSIFSPPIKNKDIAANMPAVIDALLNKKPVFIIGYGASGAGKSSSLIYFNKGNDEATKNGILMHLCNIMAKTHGYKALDLKIYEFLRKRGETATTVYTTPDNDAAGSLSFEFNDANGSFGLNTEYVHKNRYPDRTKVEATTFGVGTKLGELVIHMIDNDRFVKATTNNPNSSRSHTLIFIKLKRGGDETTLIVGDFAGVENLFNCKDDEVIGKFLNIKADNSPNRFYTSYGAIGGSSGSSKEKNSEWCEAYITKNEDLYVFSPETPIRVVDENPINAMIRSNKYFGKTAAYYGLQKLIAGVVAGDDSSDPFEVLRTTHSQSNNMFDDNKKALIDVQIKNSKAVLGEFLKRRPDPTSTPEDILAKKREFMQVLVEMVSDWNFLMAPEQFYKGTSISVIAKSNEKSILSDIKVLNADPDVFDSPTDLIEKKKKKVFTLRDKLVNHFKQRKAIFNAIVSGDFTQFPNLDEPILFNYTLQRGALVALKKVSINKFLYDFRKFFNNIVFQTMEIRFENNIKTIDELWNGLVGFYSNPNAEAFLGSLGEVVTYIFNELKGIIEENSCRMDYGRTVCDVRRAEGVMINNSLNDVREVIKRLLIEKNKSSINISPAFIEACLACYCTHNGCFGLDKGGEELGSDIFGVIAEELGAQGDFRKLTNLVVSVFCVLNVSKKANNPPPVPYLDANNVWYEINNSSTEALFAGTTTRFFTESVKLLDRIIACKEKVNEFIKSDVYVNFVDVMEKIKNNEVIIDRESDRNIVITFLEGVDKINAASAVGTLQFVDGLAKFNTTKMICGEETIGIRDAYKKRYNTLLTKFNFVDIIRGTKMPDRAL